MLCCWLEKKELYFFVFYLILNRIFVLLLIMLIRIKYLIIFSQSFYFYLKFEKIIF